MKDGLSIKRRGHATVEENKEVQVEVNVPKKRGRKPKSAVAPATEFRPFSKEDQDELKLLNNSLILHKDAAIIQVLFGKDNKQFLDSMKGALAERHWDVFQARFGIGDKEVNSTYSSIARLFGFSKTRAGQVIKVIREKTEKAINSGAFEIFEFGDGDVLGQKEFLQKYKPLFSVDAEPAAKNNTGKNKVKTVISFPTLAKMWDKEENGTDPDSVFVFGNVMEYHWVLPNGEKKYMTPARALQFKNII